MSFVEQSLGQLVYANFEEINKIIDDFETEESVKVSFSSPGRKFTELYYSGDCKEFKKVENGKLSGTYGYNQTEYLINFEDIEQIAVESQDHLSTTITVLDLIMVVVSINHTQKTVDILVASRAYSEYIPFHDHLPVIERCRNEGYKIGLTSNDYPGIVSKLLTMIKFDRLTGDVEMLKTLTSQLRINIKKLVLQYRNGQSRQTEEIISELHGELECVTLRYYESLVKSEIRELMLSIFKLGLSVTLERNEEKFLLSRDDDGYTFLTYTTEVEDSDNDEYNYNTELVSDFIDYVDKFHWVSASDPELYNEFHLPEQIIQSKDRDILNKLSTMTFIDKERTTVSYTLRFVDIGGKSARFIQ